MMFSTFRQTILPEYQRSAPVSVSTSRCAPSSGAVNGYAIGLESSMKF